MNEIYRGRNHDYDTNTPLHRLGRLILKQTSAAIVCTAIVWGMNTVQIPAINHYGDALNRALCHETDLSRLKELYESISLHFKDNFNKQTSPSGNSEQQISPFGSSEQQVLPSGGADESITEH